MGRLFGTNGVRGVFGKDFDLHLAFRLCRALAAHFERGPVLVGRDGRASSGIIRDTAIAALGCSGVDCRDAGLVPTPCLEYAVKTLGYSGGIMITASHNPPEYNGIKPVAADGVEISRDDERTVESAYLAGGFQDAPDYGMTGTEGRATSCYIDGIRRMVDTRKIEQRGIRIALDLGNGAQAAAAPELCRGLGCDVVLVNENIDGGFPGRGSEPTPENLGALSDAVQSHGADIGVAFDGDGDRSMICDEQGRILGGEASALLLCRFLLARYPESRIVTCVNSGSAIDEIAAESGSSVIRTRVGSVEVSRRMLPEGALAGFEENGGFMYGPHNSVRDGAMTAALFLEILASSRSTLSGMLSRLPAFFTAKRKVPCTPRAAASVMKSLISEFPDADTTDGVKIKLGKSSWVMLRPSGTEPIIRIYAEGDSERELDSILSEYEAKTRNLAASIMESSD